MRGLDASKEGGGQHVLKHSPVCCHGAAQSELHSSFAAQLANYPQTAPLIRSRPEPYGFPRAFLLIAALTHEKSKGTIYLYEV